MRIKSIQVGQPKTYDELDAVDGLDSEWTTSFFKEPVTGAVWASAMGLRGDGQADLRNHGGADKAINAYCLAHYPYWAKELGHEMLPVGAFGENLTLEDIEETGVCIGDIFEAGSAVLQISQPRQPCWKLSRRWRTPDLARRVEQTGKTGWYLRVLTEGELSAGGELKLINRPHARWTVAAANKIMHHDRRDKGSAAELATVGPLSVSWKEALRRRITGS